MPQLFSVLEALLPGPVDGIIGDPDALPPPRISMSGFSGRKSNFAGDPLADFSDYHLATVRRNDRITAADWFQDVRHIEFEFEDDITYVFSPVSSLSSCSDGL